jgi:hypothetical protein
VVAG